MQVGKTKDQGSYNKPSATVHPGSLATGTLPQYNTIRPGRSLCCTSRDSTIMAVHTFLQNMKRAEAIFIFTSIIYRENEWEVPVCLGGK